MEKEEKEKYLISKGWTTWWNDSNWVHPGIMAGANIDRCGVYLESAWKIQMRQEGKN